MTRSTIRRIAFLSCAGLVYVDAAQAALIAGQDFNALSSGSTFIGSGVASGSQLTNAGANNVGGPGLGFRSFWNDTRSVGTGPVTTAVDGDSGDFIGVNAFSGSNAPDIAADGTSVAAGIEHNFEFNDTDGRIDLVFDPVDVSGFTDRQLSFDYWVANTGFESDDSFSASVSDGSNIATFLDFSEPELEAAITGDTSSTVWKTATVDLESLITGAGFAETLTLTIAADTNSGSENIFVDNVAFTAGSGDGSGGDAGDGGSDGSEITAIPEIQGTGLVGDLVGRDVTTTGVVTAVDSNGFYMQDPIGDGDDATSDGIFVFTGSSPGVDVGDVLEVAGTVSEFTPGGASTGNQSTTQISSPSITVTDSGAEITPTVIGASGRNLPTEGVESGVAFFESLEGMLVTAEDVSAIAPTTRFGELYTAVNQGAGATNLTPNGGIAISEDDFNPERLQIDPDSTVSPGGIPDGIETGALIGDVTGVIGFAFGNYELIPTEEVTVAVASSITPDVTSIVSGDDVLTVASYNVLNLDPNDSDGDSDVANGRFDTIAAQIVNNLNTPDIIGLQEIQDGSGSDDDGTVSAAETLQLLVDAIAAAGGPTYAFADNTFIGDGTNGGQPGGNIRTAFLYNPDRVTLDSLESIQFADQQTNPDNPFFGSRLPLVGNFLFNGELVTLINNHFTSKGGSAPIMGVSQPFEALQNDPSINGNVDERSAQAQAVADFVASLLGSDPNANIAVLGDLNEFQFAQALAVLLADLNDLSSLIPEGERYSFIFDGNSQQLDHIFASDALFDGALFDIVNTNVDFSLSDSRASDHDPVLAAFTIGTVSDVPIPASIWLLGGGCALLCARRRRTRTQLGA
jgi:predicted extracellular nuclease